MYKSLLGFGVLIVTALFFISSFAADTFQFKSGSNSSPKTTEQPKRQPFSIEEYNKTVKTRSQESQTAMSQTLKKTLQPLPPPKTTNTPKNSFLDNQPATSGTVATQPVAPQSYPTSPTEQVAAPQQQSPYPSTAPTAAPKNNQVYTGFPSSGSGEKNQGSGSSSGGGWNIKY